jgi:ribulose-phosphate 3-epimerase
VISVGLFSANLLALGKEIERLERGGAQMIHFDVMDGCFVPPLTFGAPFVAAARTDMLKDVHLMVQNPLEKVAEFVHAGADLLTVHAESCAEIRPVLQRMSALAATRLGRRLRRGVALKPDTSLEVLEPVLDEIEYVLLLAIDPSQGKQPFNPKTAGRLRAVREMARMARRDIMIGVDGGITRTNIGEVARLGQDVVVAGSAIFGAGDPIDNLQAMAQALRSVEVTHDEKPMVK